MPINSSDNALNSDPSILTNKCWNYLRHYLDELKLFKNVNIMWSKKILHNNSQQFSYDEI